MKILITGAKGFIGKNLVAELKNRNYTDILEYDKDTEDELLINYIRDCEFVFHLAGINRPRNEEEFITGNVGFMSKVLQLLKDHHNEAPIVMTSSIQALQDSSYGRSKKTGEDLLFAYAEETGVKTFIYRLPNVFGKWCKPNYNSVVATFCNNVVYNRPIQITDTNTKMNLVYIDDVIREFIHALEGKVYREGKFCSVTPTHTSTLGEIADLIKSFKNSREILSIPNMSDTLTKKLYSTYLSYLPTDQLSYLLKMNVDDRGSFTEFIRMPDRGQISVNISKAGITKGNHWHHTKNEKFLVVSGKGSVNLRRMDSDEVISYFVSADRLEVIDIPVGYTHNIINEGDGDMVTIMWVNSPFNSDDPDTFFLEV